MPDIIDTLKSEHQDVLGLLKQLDETTDRAVKTRTDLFARIDRALTAHAKGEEAVVYPAYAERGDHDDQKSNVEAHTEHAAVEDVVLPQLRSADPGSREFAGNAKVLMEFVEHHAKEEERVIFPKMRKLFDASEREELDARYRQWKAENGFA